MGATHATNILLQKIVISMNMFVGTLNAPPNSFLLLITEVINAEVTGNSCCFLLKFFRKNFRSLTVSGNALRITFSLVQTTAF